MKKWWEDSYETRAAAANNKENQDEILFEDDKDAESQEDYTSNNPTALRLEIEKRNK